MHLLIDVRTSCLSDIPNVYYALDWADIWLLYHADDRITFLAHDGDPVERYECIFLPRKSRNFKKKIASHPYGPRRVISFSHLPTIDTSIPSIIHINELTHKLYPQSHLGALEHFFHERRYKKFIKNARQIIVPCKEVGLTLSELYGVDEDKISIIPYLYPPGKDIYKKQSILPYGIGGKYYITEGTPSDEWQPVELLRTYSRYVHTTQDPIPLVIIGDMGENLGPLSTLIRSLDIIDKVKIVGVLSREERATLYAHAKGWVYIGYYYSRGASVSLASGYDIPLYISDIAGLNEYKGISLHPTHVDLLTEIFKENPSVKDRIPTPSNDMIMEVYARVISE